MGKGHAKAFSCMLGYIYEFPTFSQKWTFWTIFTFTCTASWLAFAVAAPQVREWAAELVRAANERKIEINMFIRLKNNQGTYLKKGKGANSC